SYFDHEADSTSNLEFSRAKHMLSKHVSCGNISGAHVPKTYAPLLTSLASSNLLGAEKPTF
ncbi:hypothetical protein P9747_04800, partial [Paenibacillus macerans]|uniref:hypothetical protein n=1 Tax=Paenibacillus macerans TaxID=44252 RepID=UPI002E1DDB9C|nr:hypothetical protein [Paenibacillus macerans]